MKEYPQYHNYDLAPSKPVTGCDGEAFAGYDAILTEVRRCLDERAPGYAQGTGRAVVVCDLYPGVNKQEVLAAFSSLSPQLVIDSDACALSEEELNQLFAYDLTDDRVFGVMTGKKLEHCFDAGRMEQAKGQVQSAQGLVLVIGVGASFIAQGDVLLYFDLERWEIQLRYRAGMPNWNCTNYDAPILTKYKRGFFVEWRLADRHKKDLFHRFDYIVDTNAPNAPAMITRRAFWQAMEQMSCQPFRAVPYFDPGVWGGQWMKQVFGLDPQAKNYAWSFDGVPEENALHLRFGDVLMRLPCIDLVFCRPHQLLGEHVHARFGAEFPIRFDLLDTMEGENLSLQVHPLTEYIQENFHMHYTQDESYYILDAAEEDTYVYLGLKEGVDPQEMIAALKRAETGAEPFDAERFVNKVPVKKHDHVLIPAGTVHCSGKNTMVLEISATPYIFTFKLWDWGRLGLDGLPRPIHIEHGRHNIQWDRDTAWVYSNLVGQQEIVAEEPGVLVERTGLHQREFIDTHRYTFSQPVTIHTGDSVNVLNLIEGSEATVSSPTGAFAPYTVHYAETFIVPAAVGTYQITPGLPDGSGAKEAAVICARVRD